MEGIKMENCQKITYRTYFVTTQRGFNNALYDFMPEGYTKEEIRKMVKNYPIYYPAVVIIYYNWDKMAIYATCLHKENIDKINNYLKEYEDTKTIES